MLNDISRRKDAEFELAAVKTGLEVRVRMRTEELFEANRQLRAEIAVREAAELALERSEERLQHIITALPVALLVKDPQSRITFMNKAAEKGWGLSFPEMVCKTGSEMFTPDQMEKILATDRLAFASRDVVVEEREVWNVARVQCRHYESYKKPIFDADGQPLYLICVFVDITERKQAQAALLQSFQQLRQLTARLELMKAEDRKRIAKGIHDDLGQNLLALKLDVEMLHARAGDRHPLLKERVGHVLDTIDATIRSVREIINDLHPSTLELGLPVALESLVDQFQKRSGISCTLAVIGECSLPDTRRTSVIFRIVQESLLYVLRYAHASVADVTLSIGAEHLSITIVDDGIGVVAGEAGKEAAYALRGIRERVNVFGGELAIDIFRNRCKIIAHCDPGSTRENVDCRDEMAGQGRRPLGAWAGIAMLAAGCVGQSPLRPVRAAHDGRRGADAPQRPAAHAGPARAPRELELSNQQLRAEIERAQGGRGRACVQRKAAARHPLHPADARSSSRTPSRASS